MPTLTRALACAPACAGDAREVPSAPRRERPKLGLVSVLPLALMLALGAGSTLAASSRSLPEQTLTVTMEPPTPVQVQPLAPRPLAPAVPARTASAHWARPDPAAFVAAGDDVRMLGFFLSLPQVS